jgi:hypothetical protein
MKNEIRICVLNCLPALAAMLLINPSIGNARVVDMDPGDTIAIDAVSYGAVVMCVTPEIKESLHTIGHGAVVSILTPGNRTEEGASWKKDTYLCNFPKNSSPKDSCTAKLEIANAWIADHTVDAFGGLAAKANEVSASANGINKGQSNVGQNLK